ncbi:CapA family protein [Arsenicicoccus piscis]|uniref:CapA family protein n=1 Tax=Arsenicicoccus piscis TaxID=673954 RepID=UPI001F4C5C17|nr:CapA family protein [Arsenicicoccus piscis]MCH8629094.1 CapA family protein [Arsenicicoccus piscis]
MPPSNRPIHRLRRSAAAVATGVVGVVVAGGALAGISADRDDRTSAQAAASSSPSSGTSPSSAASTGGASTTPAAPTGGDATTGTTGSTDLPPPRTKETVTIALGGDTQSHGVAGSLLTEGLGEVGKELAAADLAMVNLETVVAESSAGLHPQDKPFTFVAPPRILDVLREQGVDVVTAANNHGMDFGAEGLRRMLAVTASNPLPVIGIGKDADQAYAPWATTVRGRSVVVFGASDVLDPHLNWTAGPDKPGMAYLDTPGGLERLEAGVRAARAKDPDAVILAYLHWGSERVRCPKPRQVELATRLSAAGANAVVGSHAHIQQTTDTVGSTAVAYGLGNFVFGSGSGVQRKTGVLTLTVPPRGTPTMAWSPALIEGGLPRHLTGSARTAALADFAALDQGCPAR